MQQLTMKNKAFTLIELIVVIAVIAILSAVVLVNYRTGQQQLALQRAANKLAQDIRRAQEMAMSAKECTAPPASCCPAGPPCLAGSIGVPPGGYGIYIDKGQSDRYFIYADSSKPPPQPDPKPEAYTSGEEIETIYLEQGVYIDNFTPPSSGFSINFKPPDPTVKIKDNNGYSPAGGEVTITIALESDPSKTKTILVNKAGRIEIQ